MYRRPLLSINEVVKRLDILEKSLSAISNGMLSVSAPPSTHQSASRVQVSVHPASPAEPDPPPVRNWADHAVSLAAANPDLSFKKPTSGYAVRVRGRDAGGAVKGVPRQLVCFAGRIFLATLLLLSILHSLLTV